MKRFSVPVCIIILFVLVYSVIQAQTPDTSPLPTPTVDIEPVPDNPEFPDEAPPLPDQLPQDPHELDGWLEAIVMFGAGLAVMWLTDQAKWLTWLTGTQKEFIKRRIAQIGWGVASVIVAVVTPLFGRLADLAQSTGVWGVLLALLSVSWLAYRGDKLLRVGTRYLAAKFG